MSVTFLCLFIGATLLSFLLTRAVRNAANARGWVYAPPSSRHIHTQAVPRLGGVAIFIAVAIGAAILYAFPGYSNIEPALSRRVILYILAPATLVFLLGLFDDFRPVKPSLKFLVQALAATILFAGGFGVFHLPLLFGSYDFGWLALPLTILWVLWITNAFNLLDGVDGLAAGSALFSTLTVFVVFLISGNILISSITLVLAGAILGFLRFNFNPATIFLGDSGSLFIGFMLSALALAGAQKTPTIVAVAIPVVSFGLPVLETVLSVMRRFLNGQPLFTADRGHIHHKLLERGFSQRQVVLILYVVSAVCGLLSLFLLYPSGPMVGVVLFVIGAGVWIGVQHLGYHEFLEIGRVAHRTIEQKRIIVNNLTIRRATQALALSSSIEGVDRILRDTFETNDFDGFDLILDPTVAALPENRGKLSELVWRKSKETEQTTRGTGWTLTLDLKRQSGQRLGTFSIYRKCNGSPLFVDINLLISGFNVALAGALDSALAQPDCSSSESNEGVSGTALTSAASDALI